MSYKLELPDIGEGVVEAEVQQWFVAPGDVVTEDQPLVEVMTDKATVVIPSPKRGRVVKLFWAVGQVAKVHSPLVELELDETAPRPAPQSPVRAAVAAAAASAAAISPGPAGLAGPADSPAPRPAEPQGPKALATPAVRSLARELGVDVNAVPGTGPGGRVTKDDLAAFRSGRNGHAHGAAHPSPPTPLPAARGEGGNVPGTSPSPPPRGREGGNAPGTSPSPPPRGGEGRGEGADTRIPLRGLRKRIAENMARSKRTAAHFTFVEQADVTELVRLKEKMAAAAKDEGVKLTFLPFVVKAVVDALRRHPRLNASLDEERQEIVQKNHWDIGVASATEQGLTVPVIRGADRRSLLDLAREIERLAADAKAGRSRPEDVGRSTFTITSLGALGGLFATPVLNHPEVGILGLHRIRPTPIAKDGQVVIRDVMHVSVTSDHRVVDGHEAAAFCYDVIRALEEPSILFLRMV